MMRRDGDSEHGATGSRKDRALVTSDMLNEFENCVSKIVQHTCTHTHTHRARMSSGGFGRCDGLPLRLFREVDAMCDVGGDWNSY